MHLLVERSLIPAELDLQQLLPPLRQRNYGLAPNGAAFGAAQQHSAQQCLQLAEALGRVVCYLLLDVRLEGLGVVEGLVAQEPAAAAAEQR